MFFGCTLLPDSKETTVESRNQEAFSSACKKAGLNLVSCCTWTCVCTAISNGMDIPEMPGYHLLRVFSEGHNNYSKDWCLMNSQPTFSIFAFDLMT